MTTIVKNTILNEGPGAFGTRRMLVHRAAGHEVAGSGTRPCSEAWGSLFETRTGTRGGQWFKTLEEARNEFAAMVTPVVGIEAPTKRIEMSRIWILDDNSNHIATITGPDECILEYASVSYPDGHIDRLGPNHINAAFDINKNADAVDL
jgi:hypothetical protein